MKNDFLIRLNLENECTYSVDPDSTAFPLSQAYTDPNTQNFLILLGRIYYQSDLLKTFPLKGESPASTAQLILSLFQKYGIAVLQQLEGEFALVIGDRQQNRFLLLRDLLGCYPLYWLQDSTGLYISSSMTDLALATKRTFDLNPNYLGQYLIFSFAFSELPTQETIYQSIQRVVPGELRQLSLDTPPKTLFQYQWNFSQNSIHDINEAGETFKDILTAAIQERIQYGKAAAHLSGGMDSSTIICLAKPLLSEPLTTLSLVYNLETLVKETDYINTLIEQEKTLETHFVQGDTLLDFQWFNESLPLHDEPYAGLFHFAIENELMQKAKSLQVSTILTGTGAELVAEGNCYYLADWLHQGQWQKTVQESQQWAIARNQNFWSIFSEFALLPLFSPVIHNGLSNWMRRGYGKWPQLKPLEIAPWINPQFAKDYDLYGHLQDLIARQRNYPIEQARDRFVIRCMSGNWAAWSLGKSEGIHISQPFLDPRLIRFCLSLPREFRTIPGESKPLLRQAMEKTLPPKIFHRKYKSNFNEPYWKGLKQNLTALVTMVRDSSLNQALPIFESEQLIMALQQHSLGLGDIASGSHLCRLLALIAWYKTQQQ
jgi:asparagine synthase (glutamine-hydrolysing)